MVVGSRLFPHVARPTHVTSCRRRGSTAKPRKINQRGFWAAAAAAGHDTETMLTASCIRMTTTCRAVSARAAVETLMILRRRRCPRAGLPQAPGSIISTSTANAPEKVLPDGQRETDEHRADPSTSTDLLRPSTHGGH